MNLPEIDGVPSLPDLNRDFRGRVT